MSVIDSAGVYFDRLVGVFSPVRQAKNSIVREIMQKERQYAAAKEDRLTGAWRPISKDVNDLIGSSAPTITGRVQQLVRDFPFFARAVDVLVNLSVGSGLTLQSRVKTGDTLNKKINQENEYFWQKWMKLHFHELCRLIRTNQLCRVCCTFHPLQASSKKGWPAFVKKYFVYGSVLKETGSDHSDHTKLPSLYLVLAKYLLSDFKPSALNFVISTPA